MFDNFQLLHNFLRSGFLTETVGTDELLYVAPFANTSNCSVKTNAHTTSFVFYAVSVVSREIRDYFFP
jgi:hypothetical protein